MWKSRGRERKSLAAGWPGEGVLRKDRDAACVSDDMSSMHMLDGEARAPMDDERTGSSTPSLVRQVWQRRQRRLRGRLRGMTGIGMTGFLELLALQLKQVAWTASSKLRELLGWGGLRVERRRELAVPTARAWILWRIESRCRGGGPTGGLDSVASGDDSKAEWALRRGSVARCSWRAGRRCLRTNTGGVSVAWVGEADASSVAPDGEPVLS